MRLSFLHCIFSSFVKNHLPTYLCIYCWALNCVPLVCDSVFLLICCLDYCPFVVEFEVSECNTSRLALSLGIALTIRGLLWFRENLMIFCFSSLKKMPLGF